jgi:hypothetical protein
MIFQIKMKGEEEPALSCPKLDLKRVVGFNGNVKDGFHIVDGKPFNYCIQNKVFLYGDNLSLINRRKIGKFSKNKD